MPQSLIIYCDESDDKGEFYSHFYGGAMVRASDRDEIEDVLNRKKAELNINSEMKWDRVTAPYKDKYIEFIKTYFEFVRSARIKVRITFTQNINQTRGLTDEHIGNDYFFALLPVCKACFWP